MEARTPGQIWQFKYGVVLAVLGVLLIAAIAILHVFFPPPSLDELRPVSGTLVHQVESHRSRISPQATFEIHAPDLTLGARINNYDFNLLMVCCDVSGIERLKPGDQITAWFTEKDIAAKTDAVAWRLQSAGKDLVSLEQSQCAEHRWEQRMFLIAFCILAVGVWLTYWGRRIAVAEKEMQQANNSLR